MRLFEYARVAIVYGLRTKHARHSRRKAAELSLWDAQARVTDAESKCAELVDKLQKVSECGSESLVSPGPKRCAYASCFADDDRARHTDVIA